MLPLLAACAAPHPPEEATSAQISSGRKLADQDEGNIFFAQRTNDDIFSLHPRVILLPARVQHAFNDCVFAYARSSYAHPARGLDMTWNGDDYMYYIPEWLKPIGAPPTPYIAALSEALSTIETGDYTPLGEFCPKDLADFEEYDGI